MRAVRLGIRVDNGMGYKQNVSLTGDMRDLQRMRNIWQLVRELRHLVEEYVHEREHEHT